MKKILLGLMLSFGLSGAALAAGPSIPYDQAPKRTNDMAALQNGARLFVGYCLNCHGASYVRYNRLTEIGLTEQQIKSLNEPVFERATALVARMREDFLKEGFTVTTEVQFNHVTDAIIRMVTFNQVDLLALGSRGLSTQERLQLGSVSETALKYAPCSVLVVRGVRA